MGSNYSADAADTVLSGRDSQSFGHAQNRTLSANVDQALLAISEGRFHAQKFWAGHQNRTGMNTTLRRAISSSSPFA
jgi:hypothetical protein